MGAWPLAISLTDIIEQIAGFLRLIMQDQNLGQKQTALCLERASAVGEAEQQCLLSLLPPALA